MILASENVLYFGARYYNSDISVWLSVDPLASGFPGISPYAYVYNNPLNYVDPWGLSPEGDEDKKNKSKNNSSNNKNPRTGYGNARDLKVTYPQSNAENTSNNTKKETIRDSKPNPFVRLFGLFNKQRRWISKNIGQNRNTHTRNYTVGLKQLTINYNTRRWKKIASGDNSTGPINYTSRNEHILRVDFDPAGTIITGTLNGQDITLCRRINNNGQGLGDDGRLVTWAQYRGVTGDTYNITLPPSVNYTWYAMERVTIRHSIKLWLPVIIER